MGSCQNYGPLLGPYDDAAPRTQNGTIILTTTLHVCLFADDCKGQVHFVVGG